MKLTKITHKPLFDLILLGLLIALFFTATLGARPYSAPSESRYIEIGREMAETGDYVTPRLNYVKYFEKPPLFYWIQAGWTKLEGVGFFVSRVPTAFFSVMFCLLTYGLARTLYGRRAAILSAIVLASSLYLFALSRIVLLDVPVSLFLAGTLTAFLYAVNAPPGKGRSFVIYAMYLSAAGAVLTKGLIGIVIPGAVIFLWLCCTGRWALLREMKIPSGTVLFLLITVPWHILVWLANPEHPQFYFIHEHFERYTSTVHGRYQPFWFFGAVLLAGLFPWIAFAYPALRAGLKDSWQKRTENGNGLFLALWIGFIFLFFTASDSKLIPYILPVFPPIAAMIGDYLTRIWEERPVAGFAKGGGFTAVFFATILLLLAVAASPFVLGGIFDANSKVAQAIIQGGEGVKILAGTALVAAILLFVIFVQARRRHVIVTLLAMAIILAQEGDIVAANYNKDSMVEFTDLIKSVERPGTETVAYDNYYQDLPVYLGHRVTIVDWWKNDKSELKFGAGHEDVARWMIDDAEFWKRWMKPNHIMFAVMRSEAFERIKTEKNLKAPEDMHLYLLLQQGNNLLFGNTPLEKLSSPQKSI